MASMFSAVKFAQHFDENAVFNLGAGGWVSALTLLVVLSVRMLSRYLAAYVASRNAQNDLSEFIITGSSTTGLSFCEVTKIIKG